jgi:hypothetical protein
MHGNTSRETNKGVADDTHDASGKFSDAAHARWGAVLGAEGGVLDAGLEFLVGKGFGLRLKKWVR